MEIRKFLPLSICLILITSVDSQEWGKLSEAVQAVVHPDAKPTIGMIQTAFRQQGLPKSFAEMMQYTPHMVALAMKMGVQPPSNNGSFTLEDLTQHIIRKGQAWLQTQADTTGTQGGKRNIQFTNPNSRPSGNGFNVDRIGANTFVATTDHSMSGHNKVGLRDALTGAAGNAVSQMAANMAATPGSFASFFSTDPSESFAPFSGIGRRAGRRSRSRMLSDMQQDMMEVMTDIPLLTLGLAAGGNGMFGVRHPGMGNALHPLLAMRYLDMDMPTVI